MNGKDNIIFENMNEDLGHIDLSNLLETIEGFDQNFGAIKTTIEHLSQKGQSFVESFNNNDYEENKEAAKILDNLKDDLKNTGLDLKLEKDVTTNMDGGEELESKYLQLILKDGKQFFQYLRSLDTNHMTNNQLAGVGITAHELIHYVYDSNIHDPENDSFYELITNGENILGELKRLGVVEFERHGWGGTFDPTKSLEDFLYYLKEGCLEEFLIGYKLRKHKFYSFIFATDPYKFKRDWENNLSEILKIHENSKAIRVYEEVVLKAKEALDKAEKQFQNSNNDVKEEFISVIKTIKLRLEDF